MKMTAQLPKHRPDLFWLVIGLIALAALLSSCSPNFYCKRCPAIVKDSVHVEYRDSIVKKDSIIKEPGETIRITDTIPCPDMKIEKMGKKGHFKIEIKDSVLTGECVIDTTEIAISWLEHHKKEIAKYYHSERIKVVEKAPKIGFGRFKDWWFYITCILILLAIVRWILRLTGKWPFPIKSG